MIAFFMIVTCPGPTTTVVKEWSDWAECQEQRTLFKTLDDPKGECVSQCVGKKVFKEVWRQRLKVSLPRV